MHDIKLLRNDPQGFDRALQRRGLSPMAEQLLEIDQQHRQILTELQTLRAQRNQLAQAFAKAKQNQEDTTLLANAAELCKNKIHEEEAKANGSSQALQELLAQIPNILASEVPKGTNDQANVLIRTYHSPPTFAFAPKQHFELGESLGLMDFKRAAKLSGSRFVILYGLLSRLERALAAFMLDIHTKEFGYQEVSLPLIVNQNSLFGTGQLPKLQEDVFQVNTGHYLIPTAEVALTNLVAEEIVPYEQLPLRFTAYTPCFRAEAGAAGKDTRGMIRQHQFSKVELVSIVAPAQAAAEHERMTEAAETVLKRLELPYRVMLLCEGDTGFAACKTYDLEVWLPGQGAYREISSCSNCGDFQARRMNARYRQHTPEAKPEFVHTLNGSGLAVGRALVAILENYQQPDGSIQIPQALLPYMGKIEAIPLEE